MRTIPIGKKYNCEEEWWHLDDPKKSQKQRDQWKSYISSKLNKETWFEQANEKGDIFVDKYIHSQCEFIRIVTRKYMKEDEKTSKEKGKQ